MKVQPNSGATPFAKGDVVDDLMVLECKTTMEPKKQFTVKKEWMDEIKSEQFQMKKEFSGVVFDFGQDPRYVILTENDFLKLISHYRDIVEGS